MVRLGLRRNILLCSLLLPLFAGAAPIVTLPASTRVVGNLTVTNMSVAGPVITSASGLLTSEAQLSTARGGTAQDFSASTGVLQVLSGTVSAASVALSSQTSGTLSTSRGGTNLTSYTTGDLPYASATNVLSKLAIGTSGQVLASSSSGLPYWAPAVANTSITPAMLSTPSTLTGLSLVAYSTTSTSFVTAGTFNIAASPTVGRPVFIHAMPNGFTFTVTAANATAAAVYQTSNGTQFTVNSTIAGTTTLLLSMTTPSPGFANGSTLTKVSGTGDSTITFSAYTPLQSWMTLAENNTANTQGAIVEIVRTSDNKVINSASWGSTNAGVAISAMHSISLLNCVDPASDGTTAYFVRVRNILTASTTVSITQALIFGMQL